MFWGDCYTKLYTRNTIDCIKSIIIMILQDTSVYTYKADGRMK